MSVHVKPDLNLIQRWFQSVITNPIGVEEGIRSPAAQELMGHCEAANVIRPSRTLTSMERLTIYASAYYLRLLECMGAYFPVLKQALGAEVFDSFVLEYLQKYPSYSYTLDRLGDHFSKFLSDTRPAPENDNENWPDFLIDLAKLEWTIAQIFDGPGSEGTQLLVPEMLQSFPEGHFADARLSPVVSLQLLVFRYPVNSYFTAVRQAGENHNVPLPEPMTERIAILRRAYIVRRYPLTEPQFIILQKILAGAIISDAISAAAEIINLDDDSMADTLQSWFHDWSQAGFFASISR